MMETNQNATICPRCHQQGFTLIELMVVIAVLGILFAILLPVLSGVREKADRVACQSNMRQVGAAWHLYATDNRGGLVQQSILQKPPEKAIGPTGEGTHTYWPDLMHSYFKNPKVLVCPGFRIENGYGIGYNTPEFGVYEIPGVSAPRVSMNSIVNPSASVVFADVAAISNPDEKDPDKWKPTPDGKLTIGVTGTVSGIPVSVPGATLGPEYNVYFRSPSDSAYNAIPHRLVNRHGDKANTWMPTGNVEARKASSVGFQYYPSSNEKPDSRWLWDRK